MSGFAKNTRATAVMPFHSTSNAGESVALAIPNLCQPPCGLQMN